MKFIKGVDSCNLNNLFGDSISDIHEEIHIYGITKGGMYMYIIIGTPYVPKCLSGPQNENLKVIYIMLEIIHFVFFLSSCFTH